MIGPILSAEQLSALRQPGGAASDPASEHAGTSSFDKLAALTANDLLTLTEQTLQQIGPDLSLSEGDRRRLGSALRRQLGVLANDRDGDQPR